MRLKADEECLETQILMVIRDHCVDNTYRLCDSNTRSDMDVLIAYHIGKKPRAQMAERVDGDDSRPLGKGTNVYSWFAVGEIWFMVRVEMFACHGQRMINGV